MENQNSPVSQEQKQTSSEQTRFSRRRFLQTGIATSPLLMAVKSPMAWGCGTKTNGSINAHVSGNASTTSGCHSSKCQPPEEWCKILKSNKVHPMKQALSWSGIHSHSLFNSMFLTDCFRWQKCSNTKWQYKLMRSRCDSPTLYNALANNHSTPKLLLRVKKGKDKSKRFDVEISVEQLHKHVSCGYLNSICAPEIIDSQYYPRDIINALNQAMFLLANTIQKNKSSAPPSFNPLRQLSRNLERSWR